MRLIDADKLETSAVLGVKLQHADSNYYYFYEEETITNAPTVKAIPVEWIERKLAEHWYVDYDIRELLEDWEKENEHKESD